MNECIFLFWCNYGRSPCYKLGTWGFLVLFQCLFYFFLLIIFFRLNFWNFLVNYFWRLFFFYILKISNLFDILSCWSFWRLWWQWYISFLRYFLTLYFIWIIRFIEPSKLFQYIITLVFIITNFFNFLLQFLCLFSKSFNSWLLCAIFGN